VTGPPAGSPAPQPDRSAAAASPRVDPPAAHASPRTDPPAAAGSRRAGPGARARRPARRAPATDADPVLEVLARGAIELEGRLVDASNTTLRGWVRHEGVTLRCVYKPVAGERPLWDFPDGTLAGREVAAYLVSVAGGWGAVPPTVLRDGPLGPGAVQLWIEESAVEPAPLGFVPAADLPPGWFSILAARDPSGAPYVLAHADDPRLARLALFDAVANNADRKGGHVLSAEGGRLYGVDHGLCFHVEDKLRTVLWGWAGTPLPAESLPALRRLGGLVAGALGERLADHLTRAEVTRLGERIDGLVTAGRYPLPPTDWPAVPWPPL